MQHQWKNSEDKTFTLNVIPPFMEELLLQEVAQKYEVPAAPGFSLEIPLPDGTTKREWYQHTDDTMTEVVFNEKATGIITGWVGVNGERLRWQDSATVAERRAWAGYKTALMQHAAKVNAESNKLFLDRMLCDGLNVDIPDSFVSEYGAKYGDKGNVKLAYILAHVCPSEADYTSLIHKLTDIRQIAPRRVEAIKAMFPSPIERSAD